jgi:hypothetical protein
VSDSTKRGCVMDAIRWKDDLGFDLPEFLDQLASHNTGHIDELARLEHGNPYQVTYVVRRDRLVLVYRKLTFLALAKGWHLPWERPFTVLAIRILPTKKAAKKAFRELAA